MDILIWGEIYEKFFKQRMLKKLKHYVVHDVDIHLILKFSRRNAYLFFFFPHNCDQINFLLQSLMLYETCTKFFF